MVSRGHRAVLLSLLVVLAGCTAIGIDRSTPTPRPVVTPAWPSSFPPGVTQAGITNPLDLVRAHTAALTGQSFTYRSRTVVSTTDGIRLGQVRTVRRVGPDGRFVHRTRVEGVVPSAVSTLRAVDAYSNGTAVIIRFRQQERNKTLITAVQESPMRRSDVVQKGPLYSMVSSTEPRVTRPIRRGGVTYLLVKGTNGSTRLGFVRVTNGTFEALIAPSGLVQRYVFRYHATDTSYREWEGRIVRTVVFEAVGSTGVHRPDWVESELPNATAVPTGR